MQAVLWSDYICPWCYLGQDRTALLDSLGVDVVARPFELHPETPPTGIPLRVRYSKIAAMCAEAQLPFNPPPVLPNSRLALSTAEWVRLNAPDQFDAVHRGLFDAYFVDGRDIGDRTVLADIAGTVVDDVAAVRSSMEEAYDAGAAGTPAWLIDDRLLIPGVQDRSYYELMVAKLTSSRPS